jgi:hypothetical protein
MTVQVDDPIRNAALEAYATTIGASPILQLRTGPAPADLAASATGTLLVPMTLPSVWHATAANGRKAKAGTWSGTASAAGVVGHYNLNSSGGTRREQGSVSKASVLTTSAATAANSNVLTFAATSGVSVGVGASGPGVPVGTTVVAVSSTTVTMSTTSTLGVASGALIAFGDVSGDMFISETTLTIGQSVEVTMKTLVCPGGA